LLLYQNYLGNRYFGTSLNFGGILYAPGPGMRSFLIKP